ncbi:hypothetical protein GLOTRDRAFT_110180 [Gloeophyllum trabeum ATCC 11539]|uniref:Zinc-ribbon 15 domain-containing protein n=1 Tax=Gloeophyllum trabeum (strain ATCC 11539 / FP-39264 / Madison 617) TaxID=670483 RepID=S7QEZ6_GLOTA|nr:uncharacterized protein GLOTRDRAFT_110180 [Gloeophyllum trabeum ATCC 11539]EPQ58401.1 hypothetical protein GLOTRDRAFT_110180 [Gloeophyllum trabeum ATCC 11539]
MDFFFCLPIMFGCPTKIKPEGDQTPRICPRCHNASVFAAKSRMWFELCFVPLIPMSSKHIWMCSICQWNVPKQPSWEPAAIGGGQYHHSGPAPPQGWAGPPGGNFAPGYNPGYAQGQPGYPGHPGKVN